MKHLSSGEGTENEDTDVQVEEYKDDIGKFRCKFCDKEFAVQRYLDAHIKVKHTKTQTFECDKCDKKFTQKKNLKRHRYLLHGIQRPNVLDLQSSQKANICHICGFKSTRLTRHLKHAHIETKKEFICHFCGRKFDRKWTLSRHVKRCSRNTK